MSNKRTAHQAFSPKTKAGQAKLSATAPTFNLSNTTTSAPPKAPLASIFTKPDPSKAEFVWHPQYRGCIHFQWGKPEPSSKVLGLDLDGTVIKVKSGAKFPKDEFDWDWWHPTVPKKIKQAYADGFAIVFISNQAGAPKQQNAFKRKLPLLGKKLDIPFHAFAALSYDEFRKPAPGMFERYAAHYNGAVPIDYEASCYVGDAAGRPAGTGRAQDHNDTDRKMALSAGLPFFTPEEYFLGQPHDPNFSLSGWDPRTYSHPTRPSTPALLPSTSPAPELVLFVGSPGSGKSTYFDRYFKPADYVWVNQDTLKTRAKCLSVVEASLLEGKSVVVDNTNPSREVRREYVELVRRLGLGTKVRVGWFEADERTCRQNSVYRALRGGEREVLPGIAFVMYHKGFVAPTVEEGFDEVVKVPFHFEGSEEEKRRWSRYLDCYPKGKWEGR